MHWQKESLERMSAAEIRAWLGSDDSIEFVDLVRHNVVLPADAAAWRTVVRRRACRRWEQRSGT